MIEDAETKSGKSERDPPLLIDVLDKKQMLTTIKIGHIQSAVIDFLIKNRIDRISSIGNVEYREAVKNIVAGYAWLSDLIMSDKEIDGVVQGALEEYEDAFKRAKVEEIIKKRDNKLNRIEGLQSQINEIQKKIIEIKEVQIPVVNKEIAEAENKYNIKIVEKPNDG